MLNIFINSTEFGQAVGATFRMETPGTYSEKRLTDNIDVVPAIYEKQVSNEKIAQLIASRQTTRINSVTQGAVKETIRVNSLNILIRELEYIASLDSNEIIIAYIPDSLLKELEEQRIKFYVADMNAETSYYSDFERQMWPKAFALIGQLYSRLLFKNISACNKNFSGNKVQADRVSIVASLKKKLKDVETATRVERQQYANNGCYVASAGDAF